ncbi:helix-turn-helix domain-containing protein [Lactococcus lactis]|jgi:phage repressor protein C with HTH and peptisase S24 domain|uniref:helix-turn-helix domain-containing protein n=1 Tax=Lactococcus lactis TaxID=1358 RepID=UPI002418286C|nr:S24 family peptidase [Lactococcus lactis]MDG4965821.1 helix-turn-helix domain-containing protein [Lactococcus lactis]MDR1822502.1 helix-turn-helix domain-containing protein [Lactococcus lactis]
MNTKIMFPSMVNYYRKLNNLTMEELANKVNKTKSTISKWESGQRSPKIYEIEEIAKLFGVDPHIMMFGFDYKETDEIISKTVNIMSDLKKDRQEKVLNFTEIQLAEQNDSLSSSTINLRKYRDEQETSTLIVHGLESAGEGEWQEDDLDMEVQIPTNEIPDDFDDLAIVLGDSMRPKLHNGDILFIKFTKQIEIGEIGVFRTSRGNFVKKLKNGYLESLNPDYEDIHFCEGEMCEAIGVVVDYYRK